MDIETLTKYIETVWTDERSSFDQKRNKTTYAIQQHLNQPNGSNMVLAVSGPSEEEIDLAAMQYATKMSAAPDKETPDWIMTDFKAGIAWLLRYQAACDSGAVDTVAARGISKHVRGAQGYNPMLGDTCEGCENERKSSEGQP